MESLFVTGRVVDLILVLVVAECAVLALWPRLRGAMSLLDIAALIAPGVMLLLAVRAALTGAPHMLTAAMLAAAFACHIADVARRRRFKAPDRP
ncbi:hypothetical protein F1654_09550 [Alkalicaulis satelles]|uniref:DUF2568 domain-containing protein n=1 Tax=Alkalicaulis satelles TaxID=2609175 RepID=A0A5M6ZJE9_9PROT|nr:hypothetical protein F1654_09550 [Alkalicaulis satelles]